LCNNHDFAIAKMKINLLQLENETKLIFIKFIHTIIWVFFNIVIFYMFYAVLTNNFDSWLLAGFAIVIMEGIVLLIFRFSCPLTILARNYSNSTKDNFDIYLPIWFARYLKLIYSIILLFILIIAIFQLLN
jgi:hypothetical protein